MDKEKIKVLAVENANKRIKEVNKNEISSIADYDRGLQEGFINGYEIAVNNIIKFIVNNYTKARRELSKEDIIKLDVTKQLDLGNFVKVQDELSSQYQFCHIQTINKNLNIF